MLAAGSGPSGVVMLDSSGTDGAIDLFGPVPFNHGDHARWAGLNAGCDTCHHYTPAGAEHPACRSCHDAVDRRQDMRRPGLKGAYHRQCLGCHREWTHTTRCGACHLLNGEAATAASTTATADDIIGTTHPAIEAPDALVFTSDHPLLNGSDVYFHHRRHVEDYELACVDCHAGDSCGHCHDAEGMAVRRSPTLPAAHVPCAACHDTTSAACNDCHRAPEADPPEAFAHAPLSTATARYHRGLSCRACHGKPPYGERTAACSGCHLAFRAPGFNHARASGLRLSADHVELDCSECHRDALYRQRPVCDACHDGVAFPAERPGRRVP